MENNENLVAEEVIATENTEQTAEQTPEEKKYTQKEVDEIVGKRIARNTAKIRREYERNNAQYEDLVNTLKAGTGKESVEELNDTFRDFYTKKGVQIESKKPAEYSAKDMEILARAEADELIRLGDEDVAEEFDRLESVGTKMTAREQAVFKLLAEHLHGSEMGKELAKIGVPKEEYNSKEFKEFAALFDPKTPITKVYETYRQTKPKKEIKTMGSMKNTVSDNNAIKDFYSPEEAKKFSVKDYDKNPALFEAVKRSMLKWK